MRPEVKFVKSAVSPKDFIVDALPKLILAGRSNAGKSSIINRMAGVKQLARVSASPGKTAHVNYFKVDNSMWWVDLPGYGYAAVSGAERARWGELMESFFKQLDETYTGVLIVDIRHKPSANDVDMADCFRVLNMPFVVVANKSDKIKQSRIEGQLNLIRETLALGSDMVIIPFSATKGQGMQELRRMFVNNSDKENKLNADSNGRT